MTSRLKGAGLPPSFVTPPRQRATSGANAHLLSLLRTLSYYGLGLFLTVIFVVPLVWMVSLSLRQPGLPPLRTIEWIPRPIAWSNYRQLFDLVPFGRYLFNSAIVTAFAIPLTVLTASWAGFAMSQLSHRLRNRLLALSVVMLMIPTTA
ncbi:MAG: carbohydrate ABC transporter permease, partial [Anaerolineales bacterium]|nr:carbohydrate ABC transporter permease [Anaerolineales bacterium]